jgi:hypothetical protein
MSAAPPIAANAVVARWQWTTDRLIGFGCRRIDCYKHVGQQGGSPPGNAGTSIMKVMRSALMLATMLVATAARAAPPPPPAEVVLVNFSSHPLADLGGKRDYGVVMLDPSKRAPSGAKNPPCNHLQTLGF